MDDLPLVPDISCLCTALRQWIVTPWALRATCSLQETKILHTGVVGGQRSGIDSPADRHLAFARRAPCLRYA